MSIHDQRGTTPARVDQADAVLSPADFQFVQKFIRERAAIVLDEGKEYLAETRLKRVTSELGLESIADLIEALRRGADKSLAERVINAMTTNETSFFRDLRPFEALRERIIPKLIERNASTRSLRMWCGAASTGQECYSVLMLLEQHFPQLAGWSIDFVATDINRDVLAKARAGEYTQFEINRGLPAPLLIKHFVNDSGCWKVKGELRDRVRFEEMNLAGTWLPLRDLDIVFLRNVLIYFDVEAKRDILGKIRTALKPNGAMILGGAESTINIDDGWNTESECGAIYYRPKLAGRRAA